jgi:hypothetical protein
MQAERWKQIEDLYQAALALPPEKRAGFLAQACPVDPQLRGEVQSPPVEPQAPGLHGQEAAA